MKLSLKTLASAGLCILLCLPPASAQTQTVPPASINIVVVEGEGVATNVRERVSRNPAVRIEDDDHRPIPGAAVVFSLPVSGTSGEFTDGGKNLAVMTDRNGVAVAHGL